MATEFDCAKSIAGFVEGVMLSEINNPDCLCDVIAEIAANPARLRPLMEACYKQTRPWLWKHAAQKYRELFVQAFGE